VSLHFCILFYFLFFLLLFLRNSSSNLKRKLDLPSDSTVKVKNIRVNANEATEVCRECGTTFKTCFKHRHLFSARHKSYVVNIAFNNPSHFNADVSNIDQNHPICGAVRDVKRNETKRYNENNDSFFGIT